MSRRRQKEKELPAVPIFQAALAFLILSVFVPGVREFFWGFAF